VHDRGVDADEEVELGEDGRGVGEGGELGPERD
jgi:hypothetical protein